MKPGITTKVFLAVLLVALAVLLAMGVAGRWSFTRGFIGYMDELALQRLDGLARRRGNCHRFSGAPIECDPLPRRREICRGQGSGAAFQLGLEPAQRIAY